MNSRNERHVTPHPEDDWKVTRPGAKRTIARTETRADGIERARVLLRNDCGGELVIRRCDGQILDSATIPPGNDPFPPADRS